MTEFAEDFKHYQQLLYGQPNPATDEKERQYGLQPRRVEEAAAVDGLVQRFVSAELDGKPIGRTATKRVLPAIGSYLQKQLDKTPEKRNEVRGAIVKTIARGYAGIMAGEIRVGAHVRLDREPEEIWGFWIPRIYSPFLREALLASDYDAITTIGGRNLVSELDDAGLGRRGKSRRMRAMGMAFAAAGAILRAAQTTQVPDDMIGGRDPLSQARFPNAWKYEDYLPWHRSEGCQPRGVRGKGDPYLATC